MVKFFFTIEKLLKNGAGKVWYRKSKCKTLPFHPKKRKSGMDKVWTNENKLWITLVFRRKEKEKLFSSLLPILTFLLPSVLT